MRNAGLIQRFGAIAIAAMLLSVSSFVAQRVSDAELQYREALRKQQVEGDLAGAIKMYQEIVSKTTDRVVQAKALLQLALSLDALGQRSESVYQQIIRDFSDQPAVGQARVRLAALRPPAANQALTQVRIVFGNDIQEVVATDGQRAVYWDAAHTTLFTGDVAGKIKKSVYRTTPDRLPQTTAVSRDLSMVFFYFTQSQQRPAAYAVVKTDGTGYREIDLIEDGVKLSVAALYGVSWSFDNRYLLVGKGTSPRKIHLFKVSVPDGETIDLMRGSTTDIVDGIASPDGQFIAVQDPKGPISILPAQGGNLRVIADAAYLADWTSDGKHFVFAAEEKGILSLFAIPIKDGQPAGGRIFIRTIERASRPITYGAAMVYSQYAGQTSSEKLYFASLNTEGRLSDWKPLDVVGPGGFYPTWSPDGKRFAYVAHTYGASASVVRIHTLAGGDDEAFRSGDAVINCVWASQHPLLYCGQIHQDEGKTDLVSIEVDTHRAEKVRSFDGIRTMRRISPDDRILYMGNLGLGGSATWPAWEIGTDRETAGPNTINTSPDGRWIFRSNTAFDGRREYQMRAAAGGAQDWKHVAYLTRQRGLGGIPIPVSFTPDSNWLLYHDKDAEGKDALFRVSTSDGEEPRRLGSYPTSELNSQLQISPDGHKFLVNAFAPPTERPPMPEYWLLQNFIPAGAVPAKR